jgi:hypothetical protein
MSNWITTSDRRFGRRAFIDSSHREGGCAFRQSMPWSDCSARLARRLAHMRSVRPSACVAKTSQVLRVPIRISEFFILSQSGKVFFSSLKSSISLTISVAGTGARWLERPARREVALRRGPGVLAGTPIEQARAAWYSADPGSPPRPPTPCLTLPPPSPRPQARPSPRP